MNVKRTVLAGLLLFFAACQAGNHEQPGIIDGVESDLEAYLFARYDEFQITELFSRNDDREEFLRAGLGRGILEDSIRIASKELYFRELAGKYEAHIGIVAVTYADERAARKAYDSLEKDGYLDNTKILTRYILLTSDSENLIVYTESVADEVVSAFIEGLSGMGAGGN